MILESLVSEPAPSVSLRETRRAAVRSLLFNVSNRDRQSSEVERRIQEKLVTFINSRRNVAAKESSSDDSDSDSSRMIEIPPGPDRFHDAIFELPLPVPVKRYLLFYRTPN